MIELAQSVHVVLAVQTLAGLFLLWLFAPPSEARNPARILGAALLLPLLNVGVEWALQDILREGTLVFQWVLFSLLAHKIANLPLPRALVAVFCLFCLMLGWGWLQSTWHEPTLTEEERLLREGFGAEPVEEEDAPPPAWRLKLRNALLDRRMMAARGLGRDMLYGSESEEKPPAGSATPTPTPSPPPARTPSPAGGMTGAEFELLFTGGPSRPTPPASTPDPDVPVPAATPTPRRNGNNGPGVSNSPAVTGEQMSDIVEVRNRSTDPGYEPPTFSVDAVGIGERGTYAIVDGTFVGVGSIIRTGDTSPRGWKLISIEPTELFWQPLE